MRRDFRYEVTESKVKNVSRIRHLIRGFTLQPIAASPLDGPSWIPTVSLLQFSPSSFFALLLWIRVADL